MGGGAEWGGGTSPRHNLRVKPWPTLLPTRQQSNLNTTLRIIRSILTVVPWCRRLGDATWVV